jgi:hypothetical protein
MITEVAFVSGALAVGAIMLECELASASLFGLCLFLMTRA